MGILHCENNKIKAFGAVKEDEPLSPFLNFINVKGKGHLPLLPSHPLSVAWNSILIFLMIMTAILTPISISFIDDDNQTFKIIDILFTIGFGIDIIFNFISVYHDSNYGAQTNLKTIAVTYLWRWFCIDLIAIVPFDVILKASLKTENNSSSAQASKFLKLLKFSRLYRVLKMVRMAKVIKLFAGSQSSLKKIIKKLQISVGIQAFFKVLGSVLALNHLFGCIWFFTARLQDFGPETWVARHGLIDEDPWTQYIASYYWASETLTTVGYGDINAKTPSERMLALVWILIGVGFYSFTIGNLSSFLADSDRRSLILKNKLVAFNNFANKVKLSEFLRQKVQNYYELNHKENVYFWIDPFDMTRLLPSHLRKHLLLHSYYPMIQNIHFFKIDANFTVSLLLHLKVLKLQKNEILYREGDPSEEIYFVSKGSVALVTEEGEGIFSFVQGTYFGELEILKKMTRLSFCQTSETSKLFACNKKIFLEGLEKFPNVKAFIDRGVEVREARFEARLVEIKTKTQFEMDIGKNPKKNPRRLLKSSMYFSNFLKKSQKKQKFTDIVEDDQNNSLSFSRFTWMTNLGLTPKSSFRKLLKGFKRGSEREGDRTGNNQGRSLNSMDTINLTRNASSMSNLNFTNALNLNKKESDRLPTTLRPSINLDLEDDNGKHQSISLYSFHKPKKGFESTIRGNFAKGKSTTLGSITPLQQNAFKAKMTFKESPQNGNESCVLSTQPKINIRIEKGLSPKGETGEIKSIFESMKSRRDFHQEVDQDKVIPEEPHSGLLKVNTKKSIKSLDDFSQKKSYDPALLKSITEKFNKMYQLKEQNESLMEELRSKKRFINNSIEDILKKQKELDILVKQFFEMKNQTEAKDLVFETFDSSPSQNPNVKP